MGGFIQLAGAGMILQGKKISVLGDPPFSPVGGVSRGVNLLEGGALGIHLSWFYG